MYRILITGAAGFVGRKLVEKLIAATEAELICVDIDCGAIAIPPGRGRVLEGQFQSTEMLQDMFVDKVDVIYHLAAVPGGTAEADPVLSKRVNLDGTLALFEKAADHNAQIRVIYASTIAVLGAGLPDNVSDSVAARPEITYGCHKAMVELALTDMTRRGLLKGISLRLPGIVARPGQDSGLKSAFMSDIFHAMKSGRSYTLPVSRDATVWIMSVEQCAENLLHAMQAVYSRQLSNLPVTLPVVRTSMASLVAEIARQLEVSVVLVDWEPDARLEHIFGRYPDIVTPRALILGFESDGSVSALVKSTLLSL